VAAFEFALDQQQPRRQLFEASSDAFVVGDGHRLLLVKIALAP
jgi:hypothetical protein